MYLEQELKYMEEIANRLEMLKETNEMENHELREGTETLLMELQRKKDNLDQTADKFPTY